MRNSDVAFFRYFPVCERDQRWGLFVTGIGSTHVPSFYRRYPINIHPSYYEYSWNEGRVLHEYQIIYIERGKGEFESQTAGKNEVFSGSVLLIFPGEWHRYRPYKQIGWDEYWVSFGGAYMDELVQQQFFSVEKPLLNTGVDEGILQPFLDLLDRSRKERIGYEQLNAVGVCQILATSLADMRQKRFSSHAEDIVSQVKSALLEQVEGTVSMTKLAATFHVSDDHLRRLFKEHAGMSPYRYYLHLKIQRARMMLRDTNMTIKQISNALGFENPFHFSHFFKRETGISPSKWRDNH